MEVTKLIYFFSLILYAYAMIHGAIAYAKHGVRGLLIGFLIVIVVSLIGTYLTGGFNK